MNNYVPAISPAVRTKLYLVYGILGTVLGAVQVGFATVEAPFPPWLKVTLAVFVFLGGAIGYTAASHTPAGDSELQMNEAGAVGVLFIIGALLVAVAILGLLGVVNLGLTICVILAIIGILLMVFDRRGYVRR